MSNKSSKLDIVELDKIVVDKMKSKYGYSNPMCFPKISKIVLSRGLGEATVNTKCIDISLQQFADITGQKPVTTIAKKSVSNFKLREGQVNGVMVTLRGKKAKEFFVKLINLVLPKIRDFRGVPVKSFDGRGNYSFGLKESAIFPEIKDEDRERGMHISIVTTANSDNEAFDLLSFYGMPFRQQQKVSQV